MLTTSPFFTQNLYAENSEQLPATKHQAEAVKGVTEVETPSSSSEEANMPVTPHQREALNVSDSDLSPDSKLTGDQEVPPVTTSAYGTSSIAIKSDKSVSGTISTSGITATAAHIHQGAKGTNGPVVISLTKQSENVWTIPAGSTLTDSQYESYKAEGLYLNVHSDQHQAGEIRAQLVP